MGNDKKNQLDKIITDIISDQFKCSYLDLFYGAIPKFNYDSEKILKQIEVLQKPENQKGEKNETELDRN